MENAVLEYPKTLVFLQKGRKDKEEFVSLDEFKQHFEQRIFERLGLDISL